MRIILLYCICLIPCLVFSQDYSEYYKLLAKFKLTEDSKEKQKINIKLAKAGKGYIYENLRKTRQCCIIPKNLRCRRNFYKLARIGFSSEELLLYSINITSFLNNRQVNKYNKLYSKHFLPTVNLELSLKIIKIFERDKSIRIFKQYFDNDTAHFDDTRKLMRKIDSSNYTEISNILKNTDFDPKKITNEAKLGIGIVLTHASTYDFAIPDSIFGKLAYLMRIGIISNVFYANSVDRFYLYKYKQNYYYNFYDKDLPIFDVTNIDKRRWEIGLEPLYLKYKYNGNLENLPKDYTYDINTVEQW